MNRKEVNLLWSGGWDGTFRFLQLMQHEEVVITPIYINDPGRKSTPIEKRAMGRIVHEAAVRYPGKVRRPVFYEKDWILENCKDEEISTSFQQLRENYGVGTQYEWFALLCRYLGVTAEAAVVHQYHGKVEDAIEAEGILEQVEDPILGITYRVLSKGDNRNAYNVFENLMLPVIKLTKKDEEDIARQEGFLDILDLSWFCHTPINGKPCGLCGPCDDAMNTGMEWRMPKEAIRRYKHKKFYQTTRKAINKIGISY